MNRLRLLATLALAVALGLAASFLVYQKLRQSAVRAAGANHPVVVATRNLEIGAKLDTADLKVVDWAAGSAPEGSFSKVGDAIGRAVLYPTFSGEIVLEAKLAAAGAGAGLPAVIPEGMRAVSIRVDDVVAVAGFVGPGTHVDVLLTGDPNGGRSGDGSLTRTILENVQVLAAGQKIQPDEQGKAEKVNVVTLLCTPEDAAKLTLAASDGRIQLVLRNPTDTLKIETQTLVARPTLYGKAAPATSQPVVRARPKPAAPAPPVEPPPPPPPTTAFIQVITGGKIAKVEVPL